MCLLQIQSLQTYTCCYERDTWIMHLLLSEKENKNDEPFFEWFDRRSKQMLMEGNTDRTDAQFITERW